jgi:2-succinyl-5-enolpyruvyl-6-hydroxy-3-cyclohexene-1-carboxylate synthase
MVQTSFVVTDPAVFWREAILSSSTTPAGWLDRWVSFEIAAQAAISSILQDVGFCEPAIARFLAESLAGHAPLVVSSSMPIRDVEWFGRAGSEPLTVLANRGANGIDGVVSTAMGAASAGLGPVVALVGDLAFLHDVSALVDGVDDPGALTVVVPDNDGGGIFSFLPQRTLLEDGSFEDLFGTPRSVDPAVVAAGFGVDTVVVRSLTELDEAVEQTFIAPGLRVVVCRVPPRDDNVEIHRRLNDAVIAAVDEVISQR